MDKELKHELALMIKNEIEEEFKNIHLSRNLMETIEIEETDSGYDVVIPAYIYDIETWYKHGIVAYTSGKSYASQVDKTGGFSGKHKGYVERCIKRALDKWMAKNNIEGKVE